MRQLRIGNYIINAPIFDILKKLKSELTNGKLARMEDKGDWVRITCPVHSDGHESNPSCGVYVGDDLNTEYGYTHCFTCGIACNFIQCVAYCLDSDYSYAKSWLTTNYGVKSSEQELQLEPIILNDNKEKDEYLDESVLSNFTSWHPYLEKRKLIPKVCTEFKVCYDPKSECVVFPVYDEKGKLWMLTRRSVKNKTFIIDKNKDKPVYLMYYIRQHGIKEVTVMESQINALTGWGWGVPSVATFGCNVTNKQMEVFNKSGLQHIYLCYDGDDAGIHGTKRFLERINKNILVDVIIMDKGKDVNDITEERFNQLPILSSEEWLRIYGK